jgi:hypothetical protein
LARESSAKTKPKQPDLLLRFGTQALSPGNELAATPPDPRLLEDAAAPLGAAAAEAAPAPVAVARVRALELERALVAVLVLVRVLVRVRVRVLGAGPGPEEAAAVEVHRRRCERFEQSVFGDSRPLASDPLAVSAGP